jgi:hypothetical protein
MVSFLGSCSSFLYVRALWEAGLHRCGKEMAQYGGWHVGFNGQSDAFICTVRDARLRVVAQKEVPVEDVMGWSGSLPVLPAVVAYGLEDVDEDAP